MNVPFLDLKAPYRELQEELDAAYRRVMESGWYILGEEIERFERDFADYCKAKHCIGVGDGLDALVLILRGYDIGPGDEVIVPANTYIASWLAVSYVGATPVPVEPDEATYNIDPNRIAGAITPNTRAVMPVHLYGRPAAMQEVFEIAQRHGLCVVADAAQAHGAVYRGKPASGLGDAAGVSFYPGKNLGALGDAGAVITNDDHLADRVRVLRNYGSRRKYYNEVKGFNSRLDPLQAALLGVKLRHLDAWNRKRWEIAQLYLKKLASVSDIQLPSGDDEIESSWHLFVVRHPRRDLLQRHLDDLGIGTLIHYPVPPHLSGAYAEAGWKRGDFPITEAIADTVLSLPIGPHLPAANAQRVIDSLLAFNG